jgi:hypothetical protein|nr:MAG TPA: hypothetical protein [Caudoviricetes sp.]
MAHLHPVYDTDPHFSINPDSRVITYMSTDKLIIIQEDHNSERYTFEIPRYVDGHDMMLCDQVQVHYINIDSENSKNRGTGVYKVTDLQLSPDDENVVVCSWLISQNATLYVGSLNFVLRFACTSGSKIDYAWSTGVYSSVTISKTIDNAELVIEQYADVLQAWYMELLAAGTTGVNIVVEAQNEALARLAAGETEAGLKALENIKAAEATSIENVNKAEATRINAAETEAINNIKAVEATAIQNVKNTEADTIENEKEELIQELLTRIPSYNGEVVTE